MLPLDDTTGHTELGGTHTPPGSFMRRLRDNPQETVYRLAEDIGPRPPTSLGEARAAAYIDGRLRRAGMRVSADTFEASIAIGAEGLLVGMLAIVSVLLYYWFPYPALVFSLVAFGVAIAAVFRRGTPLLARRRPCQSVVATRAANDRPRRRLVLLAPLDTPPASERFERLLGGRIHMPIGRLIAISMLLLFEITGTLMVDRLWLYLSLIPFVYLMLSALVDGWALTASPTPGAISHAGALAVLLAACEALEEQEKTELWAVAIGATTAQAGLADMLRRYPFDQDTFFIGLEGIGDGELCYLSHEGWLLRQASDVLLAATIAEASIEIQAIIPARSYTATTTLAGRLLANGYRALTLTCLGSDGRVPRRAQPDDTADRTNSELLEKATRLVVEVIRRFDAMTE